ncbi:hypothetical protein Barb7_00612 [Bacteroidales bacterium Barb7]|nr:hypothetical protein Barb7_00612 [Bacteroidales bacterium Barb7]
MSRFAAAQFSPDKIRVQRYAGRATVYHTTDACPMRFAEGSQLEYSAESIHSGVLMATAVATA